MMPAPPSGSWKARVYEAQAAQTRNWGSCLAVMAGRVQLLLVYAPIISHAAPAISAAPAA